VANVSVFLSSLFLFVCLFVSLMNFTCFWIKPNQKTSTKGGVKKWNNLSLFFFFYDVK